MAWLVAKLHPGTDTRARGWGLMIYAVFVTHVLLDCLTVYGTQVLWPVDPTPVAWGSLFIIDPLFTLPLIVGLIAVMVTGRRPLRGYRINAVMLAVSTLYAGWSLAASRFAEGVARESLARRRSCELTRSNPRRPARLLDTISDQST